MGRPSFAFAVILALGALPAAAQDSPAAKPQPLPETISKSPAQLRATELDRLFGQLHAADAENRAAGIEEKIWANWGRSDSATAELLLGQVGRAMAGGEKEVALPILNELVKAYPDFAEAWNRRATLFYEMRRYDQSLADIDKVLELEPRHFGALAGRGMIYMQLGKPDQALLAYREALAINPYMQGIVEVVKQLEKERPDI